MFCKGDESLEDEEYSSWSSEVDNVKLRANQIEADPLATTEVAEELNVSHSTVLCHLKQTGKVKRLHKWVHLELTTNQKIMFKCHLLFYATMNHSLIGL